jgi:hypothetical protein
MMSVDGTFVCQRIYQTSITSNVFAVIVMKRKFNYLFSNPLNFPRVFPPIHSNFILMRLSLFDYFDEKGLKK